ncbi:hypothetical protein PACTADRAFT_73477 [Pachysolen tannophilus NRRL Y-2460]|uniref:DUF1892 domain-containing protein n=1 Tax=Pachysolen tannophilus NRRL Y-2460 TaxID=669874 RepID=A0A1E4U1E1_PACTA|nr:hypothetical protein PACTADRAFT_73477 [Pachysolen tannophilus NRRL Y-2460]
MSSEQLDDSPELHQPENDQLDHDFRIMLVVQSKDIPEGEMEELTLQDINTFTAMNKFFDSFDEEICLKNEKNIKYDVGSDGLIVVLVDNRKLKDEVSKFIEAYRPN